MAKKLLVATAGKLDTTTKMTHAEATGSSVDLTNPTQFRMAVQNIRNVHNATSPATREKGKHWYDRVNEATAKGVRGTGASERAGAGMVAAVSPSMDFDNRNIHAFKELNSLKGAQWKTIHASAASGSRTPDARSVLKGKGISTANDGNLVKAHRIMEGEDPDVVLPRRTAPKTNSFFHNIHEPDQAGPVTIDGRAYDVAVNKRVDWKQGRGISSADTKTGKVTRYEHFENAYRSARDILPGNLHPHQLQAVVWEGGKEIEKQGLTKQGQPRKVGVPRVGQPYV